MNVLACSCVKEVFSCCTLVERVFLLECINLLSVHYVFYGTWNAPYKGYPFDIIPILLYVCPFITGTGLMQ